MSVAPADTPAPGGPIWSLRLLGEPVLCRDGVPLRIANRKLACLLGILALSPGRAAPRERLTGLLWSETDEDRARGSLRQAVAAFRRTCAEAGFDGFRADRWSLRLEPGLPTDLDAVEARCAPGDLHPDLTARDDLAGALLQGCDDLDPAFATWIAGRRSALRDRWLARLTAALDARSPGAPGAEDLARAVLRLDPAHEAAARAVMTARAMAGDLTGAMRVYACLWRVLDEDFDMEPSGPTVELIAAIKSGAFDGHQPWAVEARAPAHRVRRPALPVLRVDAFTLPPEAGAAAQTLLAGARHALIADLVHFRDWRVIDAPAAPAPAALGTAAPPPGPGDPDDPPPADLRLRAQAHPVAGVAGALDLILTVTDAVSGRVVWSDRPRLGPRDWPRIQAGMTRRLVLALTLAGAEAAPVAARRRTPGAPPADWLRAMRLIRLADPLAWAEADRLIRRMCADLPHYAPAWSARARLLNARHLAHPGLPRAPRTHRGALELARRAVSLDPLDARAQLSLARALVMCGRWDQGLVHLDLALQLNGHDAWILTFAAETCACAGQPTEARRLAAEALQAGPTSRLAPWGCHALIRLLGGDAAGAVEAARMVAPDLPGGAFWRALALGAAGRPAQARAEARVLLDHLAAHWRPDAPFTAQAAAAWLAQLLPIRREADWRRLRDGLAVAGLPTEILAFDPSASTSAAAVSVPAPSAPPPPRVAIHDAIAPGLPSPVQNH